MTFSAKQLSSRVIIKGKFLLYNKMGVEQLIQFLGWLTPWQTCSIKHHLKFFWKHPAMLQLMHEDYSYTNIHHCL